MKKYLLSIFCLAFFCQSTLAGMKYEDYVRTLVAQGTHNEEQAQQQAAHNVGVPLAPLEADELNLDLDDQEEEGRNTPSPVPSSSEDEESEDEQDARPNTPPANRDMATAPVKSWRDHLTRRNVAIGVGALALTTYVGFKVYSWFTAEDATTIQDDASETASFINDTIVKPLVNVTANASTCVADTLTSCFSSWMQTSSDDVCYAAANEISGTLPQSLPSMGTEMVSTAVENVFEAAPQVCEAVQENVFSTVLSNANVVSQQVTSTALTVVNNVMEEYSQPIGLFDVDGPTVTVDLHETSNAGYLDVIKDSIVTPVVENTSYALQRWFSGKSETCPMPVVGTDLGPYNPVCSSPYTGSTEAGFYQGDHGVCDAPLTQGYTFPFNFGLSKFFKFKNMTTALALRSEPIV